MRHTGHDYEERAVELVTDAGLRIVARNFATRGGEIDIIALDAETLVFIEVRARNNPRFESAAGSVSWRKQRRLIRAAQRFLQMSGSAPPTSHYAPGAPATARRRKSTANCPCRFDVIAFEPPQSAAEREVRWIKGAFTA